MQHDGDANRFKNCTCKPPNSFLHCLDHNTCRCNTTGTPTGSRTAPVNLKQFSALSGPEQLSLQHGGHDSNLAKNDNAKTAPVEFPDCCTVCTVRTPPIKSKTAPPEPRHDLINHRQLPNTEQVTARWGHEEIMFRFQANCMGKFSNWKSSCAHYTQKQTTRLQRSREDERAPRKSPSSPEGWMELVICVCERARRAHPAAMACGTETTWKARRRLRIKVHIFRHLHLLIQGHLC